MDLEVFVYTYIYTYSQVTKRFISLFTESSPLVPIMSLINPFNILSLRKFIKLFFTTFKVQ